ncbi:MAG: carbon storage regulator CsrA [Sphingobacteriia bacterium]|nr:carbon storage regulator CsrA [Sphingobacteriia bacterium]
MLYLTRKIGESVIIGNNVTVTITEIKGKNVKLGFKFPPNITVLREEVFEKISKENKSATSININDLESLKKTNSPE